MAWSIAYGVLDYLRVLLSPQCVAGAVLVVFFAKFSDNIKNLFDRIAKITLPGGTEFATPQLVRSAGESGKAAAPPQLPADETPPQLAGGQFTEEQLKVVREVWQAERMAAYLWEYRYLNFFLARSTQEVLDWLATIEKPVNLRFYDRRPLYR